MKQMLLTITLLLPNLALADWVLETKIEMVAEAHGLSSETFRAVLVTESNLRLDAVNHKTHDYGIGQLNIKTIEALGLDKQRLLTDLDYSLNNSAKVLQALCRYNPRECVGRYNVGTGALIGKRGVNYAAYVSRVSKNLQKRFIAGGYIERLK